ncbi:YqcI/YcgG family protein [Bacillus sp. RAR_GA_16]|uniref:YqcI/YcgG family protein n=1 Tax=Bacillus sp. RAR_GA_16 TaxID=2876774 RepID=UPI001CCB421F|nr:YqcI/YcgG family protein [Bacillus sp. RAR_GA_16]MCA0173804.1 YqcI/YcgG family protein [Bacillus sp. RAR_GA_16]
MEEWQRDVYAQFSAMLEDGEKPYPCIPGKQGFHQDHLRFGFVEDPTKSITCAQLATLLKEYGEVARDTGKYASLVVFFDSRTLVDQKVDVEQYQSYFWSLLNKVHELDEKPWPEDIPTDPHDPKWEFCFNGEPYFAFCATPAHQVRKSRQFPCFLIAFQPRWVFDEINAETIFGQKLKKAIRQRLVSYDGIPAHPALKWYGQQDNYEWEQYFLSDDEASLSKCPFHAMKNKWKSIRS